MMRVDNESIQKLNYSKNVSRILALADIAWKPNDNEMQNVSFVDYDWGKWS